ncbi:asparagine synthase (glutamine-hydrolyzing) [Nitrospinota bacterium]
MCGILGYIGEGFRRDPARALTLLEKRGPDDSGEWSKEGSRGPVWFGHRRLSILDLTRAGRQPMTDSRTGNVVVLNGEIYNFRELRKNLEKKGYAFRSSSDTEVVLSLFADEGISFVNRLRGQFAMAVWEEKEERLWFVRDRLGIKPLYIYRGPEGLAFGSECGAVQSLLPDRSWKISADGLASFMAWGSVREPCTLWESIEMFPPGTYASWDAAQWTEEVYWRPDTKEDETVSEEDAVREIRRLAEEAVSLRTVSDVPVGAFLSGGIDSSVLVGLLSGQMKEVRTHTVAFSGTDCDESPFARVVSERHKTAHHVVTLSREEIPEYVSRAVESQDQPTIDGVNTWIVSEAARRSGLKVAMSGQGGDELFYGYDYYRSIRSWRSWRWKALEPFLQMAPFFREDQKGRLKAVVRARRDEDAFPWMRAFWAPSQLRSLGCIPRAGGEEVQNGVSLENRYSWYELRHYLRNTLLRDTDVMGMAHGLEIRVPFLDHEFVEFVLRLPPALKWGDGRTQKYLLVRSVQDLLPEEIVNRPKSHFTLPFSMWIKKELRADVESGINRLEEAGLLRKGFAKEQWNKFLEGKQHWSRVWQLFVLGCRLGGNRAKGKIGGTE